MAKRISKAEKAVQAKRAADRAQAAELFRSARYWLADARRCISIGWEEGARLSFRAAMGSRAAAKTWLV